MAVRLENLPMMVPERVEAKLISCLCNIHYIREMLFVSKYKQHNITKLIPKSEII